MKLLASITEEEWQDIERFVDCEYSNPLPDEFVFYDASLVLEWRLRLAGIPVWRDNDLT